MARPRTRPAGYTLLASRIFQGATTGDLGRAAGTKSITPLGGSAENWTLVNGTANFLSADPNGCYIDANGLNLKSGSSACSDDWGDGNTLGPCIYKLVSEIVPASLWAATSLALCGMYAFVDIIWIVDGSAANANTELVSCGQGATSAFGDGIVGRVGHANSGNSAGSASEISTYNGNAVLTSSFSFPGNAIPTAIRVRVSPQGQTVDFGVASGLTPPSDWYSRDAIYRFSQANTPNQTGVVLNKDMVVAMGLVDSNGGGNMIGIAKALYIYGQRHPGGQTVSVAA